MRSGPPKREVQRLVVQRPSRWTPWCGVTTLQVPLAKPRIPGGPWRQLLRLARLRKPRRRRSIARESRPRPPRFASRLQGRGMDAIAARTSTTRADQLLLRPGEKLYLAVLEQVYAEIRGRTPPRSSTSSAGGAIRQSSVCTTARRHECVRLVVAENQAKNHHMKRWRCARQPPHRRSPGAVIAGARPMARSVDVARSGMALPRWGCSTSRIGSPGAIFQRAMGAGSVPPRRRMVTGPELARPESVC